VLSTLLSSSAMFLLTLFVCCVLFVRTFWGRFFCRLFFSHAILVTGIDSLLKSTYSTWIFYWTCKVLTTYLLLSLFLEISMAAKHLLPFLPFTSAFLISKDLFVTMSESAVIIKTRKFKRNPLLSRKQVCHI
jgi:hypothetical protein